MEQWTTTRDTWLAAALLSLGVACRLHKTLDEKRGLRYTIFHLALKSSDGRVSTLPLVNAFASGALEDKHPAHPLLACMRGYVNRQCLIDVMRMGARYELAEIPGTRDYVYHDSPQGLPGLQPGVPAVETRDLNLAAALATAGFPLQKIEGSGELNFFIRAVASHTECNAITLVMDWRRDESLVRADHPFAVAMRGLVALSAMLKAVSREVDRVLIQKPNSLRSALVRADATPEAWDKMKRFFDK